MSRVEVIVTDDFTEWYRSLALPDADAVALNIERLEQRGVTLDHPYTSAIEGTKEPLRKKRKEDRP